MRVLVVEDEPLMAGAIRDGLRLEAIAAELGVRKWEPPAPPAHMNGVCYAAGLDPMNFHACFEAYLGGTWYLFDPTDQIPPDEIVIIAPESDSEEAAAFAALRAKYAESQPAEAAKIAAADKAVADIDVETSHDDADTQSRAVVIGFQLFNAVVTSHAVFLYAFGGCR